MKKRVRTEPTRQDFDTIILEPRTTITTFEGIPWGLQKAVGGAIAAMLFGKSKEARAQFYTTAASRRNKEVLVELASQVYSYLNGTISEFADMKEYAFRVWAKVEANRRSGAIVGEPLFDVEMYKFVGRVSAQTVEVKGYSLNVTFIGQKDDKFVTPFMQRALKRAKTAAKFIQLEMYSNPSSSPKGMRKRAGGVFPILFVDEASFPVKTRINEKGTIQICIQEGSDSFTVKGEEDILTFLSKKSGVKPEILGVATAFQPVDQEIQKISQRISESAKGTEADFVASLGLDEIFANIDKRLKSAKQRAPTDELRKRIESASSELQEIADKFRKLKIEYETVLEELESLDKDLKQKSVTHDQYDVARVKSLRNKKTLEQDLIDLQSHVKREVATKVSGLIGEIKSKKTGEKK